MFWLFKTNTCGVGQGELVSSKEKSTPIAVEEKNHPCCMDTKYIHIHYVYIYNSLVYIW